MEKESEEKKKRAGKIRKKLHIQAAEGNSAQVRIFLRELYDSSDSPINDAPNTPHKFSALLESTILSLLSSNQSLGNEMVTNVNHLYHAYEISEKDKEDALSIIQTAVNNFKKSELSFSNLCTTIQVELCENTCFKSIKIERYKDNFTLQTLETNTS